MVENVKLPDIDSISFRIDIGLCFSVRIRQNMSSSFETDDRTIRFHDKQLVAGGTRLWSTGLARAITSVQWQLTLLASRERNISEIVSMCS